MIYSISSINDSLPSQPRFNGAKAKSTNVQGAINTASQLIQEMNKISNWRSQRDKAAELLTDLANRYSPVLDLVFKDAIEYSFCLCEEDSDPYHPNSIDLLSSVTTDIERVVQFLDTLIQKNPSSLARWNAIRVLCAISEDKSTPVLKGLITRSIRLSDIKHEIETIESIKGKEFTIELCRQI